MLATAAALLGRACLADAAHYAADVCVHEAARVDLSPEPVMIGCAVRGCCAGCAPDAAIDVRIDVEGEPFARVSARLEGSDAGALAASMQVEGAGTRTGSGVDLGVGATWLRGLAAADAERVPRLRLLVQPDARELRAAASPPPVAAVPGDDGAARPAAGDASARDAAASAGTRENAEAAPSGQALHGESAMQGEPEEEAAQWQVPAQVRPSFGVPAAMAITVTQTIGEHVVARDSYHLRLQRCPVQKPRTDRILVTSNDGGDEAVVLLHAARDGECTGAELWRTRDVLQPGNLVAADSCPSEITVFSVDDAIVLRSVGPAPTARRPAPRATSPRNESRTPAQSEMPALAGAARDVAAHGWSDLLGERLEVALDEPPTSLPLRIWILGAAADSVLAQRSRFETAVADMLLNESRCGISTTKDVEVLAPELGAEAVAALHDAARAASAGDCAALVDAMASAGLASEGRAGVLYMEGWPAGAVACARHGVIAIGAGAQPESLAHALGHLLGLEHSPPAFADNLMQPHVAMRRNLTEGQCFRASLEPRSILNRHRLRHGPIRACDVPTARACPPSHWKDMLGDPPPAPSSPDATARVAAWLECEDCGAELLAALTTDADSSVPLLEAVVAGGPSRARDDALRHHLTGLFLRLQAYAGTHPHAAVPWTLQQAVERYRAAFDLLVRSRAAQALSATGAPAPQERAPERKTDRKNDGSYTAVPGRR